MDSNGCYQSISHPRKPLYTKNDSPSSFPGWDIEKSATERERGTEGRRNTKARDFVSLIKNQSYQKNLVLKNLKFKKNLNFF